MDVQQAIRDAALDEALSMVDRAKRLIVDDDEIGAISGPYTFPKTTALISAGLADARAQGAVEVLQGLDWESGLHDRRCADRCWELEPDHPDEWCGECAAKHRAEDEATRTAAALRELVEG